jgi:hypothetical protein
MNTYYTGKHASRYNRTWRSFLQKTLAATLSAIDVASLQQRASPQERPLRILDAACGTGLLLEQLTHLLPHAELYGIDKSQGACLSNKKDPALTPICTSGPTALPREPILLRLKSLGLWSHREPSQAEPGRHLCIPQGVGHLRSR